MDKKRHGELTDQENSVIWLMVKWMHTRPGDWTLWSAMRDDITVFTGKLLDDPEIAAWDARLRPHHRDKAWRRMIALAEGRCEWLNNRIAYHYSQIDWSVLKPRSRDRLRSVAKVVYSLHMTYGDRLIHDLRAYLTFLPDHDVKQVSRDFDALARAGVIDLTHGQSLSLRTGTRRSNVIQAPRDLPDPPAGFNWTHHLEYLTLPDGYAIERRHQLLDLIHKRTEITPELSTTDTHAIAAALPALTSTLMPRALDACGTFHGDIKDRQTQSTSLDGWVRLPDVVAETHPQAAAWYANSQSKTRVTKALRKVGIAVRSVPNGRTWTQATTSSLDGHGYLSSGTHTDKWIALSDVTVAEQIIRGTMGAMTMDDLLSYDYGDQS